MNFCNFQSTQAIHPKQNCQQYQDELRYAGMSNDQRSELCLDEIVKKNLGMRCTTCKVILQIQHKKVASLFDWKVFVHSFTFKQIVIMKREGCDYLRCSMCKTELCWATKQARWGPGNLYQILVFYPNRILSNISLISLCLGGHGDTSGGCGCSIAKRCHPKCRNCHWSPLAITFEIRTYKDWQDQHIFPIPTNYLDKNIELLIEHLLIMIKHLFSV